MNTQDKSENTARAILAQYLFLVQNRCADSVEAVILVGSLATESYIPGPGDIDQITILRDGAPDEMFCLMSALAADAMKAFDRAINLSPVVYRRAELERPWQTEWDLDPRTKHTVCVPEELLRIHDHGKILFGSGISIAGLPMPTRDEMIEYARRWRAWNKACAPKTNPSALSLRLQVQVILSNAIWHYYYATGKTCFNKHAIAQRLANELPSYRFQQGVALATRIRMSGFANVSGNVLDEVVRCCSEIRAWNESHHPGAAPIGEEAEPSLSAYAPMARR